MNVHQLIQGTPEWLAHRSTTYNASDAPAMLGCSPYETRSQLLARLHSGITPEHDAATERRFADGHRFEALARPLAELIAGDDFAALSGSIAVDGLSRPLAASFDGITLMFDTVFEHKSLNDELRAVMVEGCAGDALPKVHRVQMEQQLLVSGGKRVLFMASTWDADNQLVEERHCWYYPNPHLRAEILAGWKQFDADLAAYVPPSAAAVEKIVAEPVEALPAPVVQVTGTLTLQDNFKVFEERLKLFLATKLIREPKTDEDFVNLDAQIRSMKAGREALKSAKAQMLGQVEPVDRATKTADMLDKLLQQNVSMAEGLLTAEKDRRKGEIVAGGVKALADHITALNARIGKPYMPVIPSDFGGVIKGLKSLASMEDKVAGELARCKIEANRIADGISVNMTYLRENATEYVSLFPDTAQIVLKAPDDLQALVKARIAEHKAKVQAEAEAAAEKERARIRAEEQAAAEKAAREKLAREQAEANELGKRTTSAATASGHEIPNGSVSAAQAEPTGQRGASEPVANAGDARVASGGSAQPFPAANVVPIGRPAASADDGKRINLGEIKDRLHPIQLTADGLAELGFKPVATEKASKLYRAADFPLICDALIAHINAARDTAPMAA